MADADTVLQSIPGIRRACRPLFREDPGHGGRISLHQARILTFLDAEDPAMVGELAEHLGVTASTMSLSLKRLEAAGYVHRRRDPLDRRVTNVLLTDAGVRVRDASRDMDPERVQRMLSLLRPDDRVLALRGLALLSGAAARLLEREREDVEAQV